MVEIVLPAKGMKGEQREQAVQEFADQLQALRRQIGFKVSSRGWCYQLEQAGLINKSQFDLVENIINACRRDGNLPIDFTAEEEGRKFSGIEKPTSETPVRYMRRYLQAALEAGDLYTPDWWDGEEYYIQMLVEKIDIKTLFSTVCTRYHIPIATAKGWSSMLQRAEYARRFQEAEDNGLKCVLLYFGDFDADGLRISDFIRSNLEDLASVSWEDGTDGYSPEDLIIERFGLNYETIQRFNLSWIDNLITGSGKNLASPSHKNFHMDYVQQYLANYGARKCESNALVPMPQIARELCQVAIEKYLGRDARQRFGQKREEVNANLTEFFDRTGLDDAINNALRVIDSEEDGDEGDDEGGDGEEDGDGGDEE